jgi:conjugative relaxase-like TrwC/TraI family protein
VVNALDCGGRLLAGAVTVSIRRMSLGSGFKYLMSSVAVGDGGIDGSSLTRYYTAPGTPSGRFLGAGLAGLADGAGVPAGTAVSAEALWRMLGMLADPVTGTTLGRAPNRAPQSVKTRIDMRLAALDPHLTTAARSLAQHQIAEEEHARQDRVLAPVAGFDLTFSVPKSVSTAWGLADEATKAVIYAAHREAIDRTVAYAEQHVLHSRSGTNGVVQEDIRGVIAAAFDHWDSRAADPHLHTHVVVLNRAQSLDGTWRTLDSRGLFKHVVTLSEMHEGILSDLLTARLGWGFDPRTRTHSAEPRHDVVGVPDVLMAEFSQRSHQIEASTNELIADYVTVHGHRPGVAELQRLRQQATLATRSVKTAHTLEHLTALWRARAAAHIGIDPAAWVTALRDRNTLPLLRPGDFDDVMLRDLGALSTAKIAGKRSTFTRANVLADVHRQLHGIRFISPDERISVAERTTDLALTGVLLISAPVLHHTPTAFLRPDGSSRFRGKGTEVYTTRTLLDAEDRLLEAGRGVDGPVIDGAVVGDLDRSALPGKRHRLSADQAAAVTAIVTSGRVLDVLVGPAGTGKSTSMAGLKMLWERHYGLGSVIGLAPSAAAAEVLAEELGCASENTAKWLTEAAREPERRAQITLLTAQLALHSSIPRAQQAISTQITRRTRDVERWRIHANQLVIVDEASLAGTLALDDLVTRAASVGAKVLLVGDWAQLSPVAAGGAFGMLVGDRTDGPELVNVRRFTNTWEQHASMQLRLGSVDAVTAYTANNRVHGGDRDAMLDALYTAWNADIHAGLTSLMIAGDTATVTELNTRAHAERVAAGDVDNATRVEIAAGQSAGVGDLVVTRRNDRALRTGRDWVKNGDHWTIGAVRQDGSIVVRRSNGTGHPVVLPGEYVREHVELGYATTAHRAQGRTVDTAHALISATTTREVAYVAATRGRDANHLYIDTTHDPDHDTSHGPIHQQPATQVLAAVLANVGADLSAHDTIATEQETATSWATLVAEYETLAVAALSDRYSHLLAAAGLSAEHLLKVRQSDAFGPLLAALREAEARTLDLPAALPHLLANRSFTGATDIASVLHQRVDRWIDTRRRSHNTFGNYIAGLIPKALHVLDPDMARALTEREDTLEIRARHLAETAIGNRAPWIAQLGNLPADPAGREEFLRAIITVAAYQDRWSVTNHDPTATQRARTREQETHHHRANAGVIRAIAASHRGPVTRNDNTDYLAQAQGTPSGHGVSI